MTSSPEKDWTVSEPDEDGNYRLVYTFPKRESAAEFAVQVEECKALLKSQSNALEKLTIQLVVFQTSSSMLGKALARARHFLSIATEANPVLQQQLMSATLPKD